MSYRSQLKGAGIKTKKIGRLGMNMGGILGKVTGFNRILFPFVNLARLVFPKDKDKHKAGESNEEEQLDGLLSEFTARESRTADNDKRDQESSSEIGSEFCTNCRALLTKQVGFDPSLPVWVCKGCGCMMINPLYPGMDSESGIVWMCDKCEALLQLQDGFSEDCGTWKCKKCGNINRITAEEIYENNSEYLSHKTDPTYHMAQEDVLRLTEYRIIETLNEAHEVYLVERDGMPEKMVRKTLRVCDRDVIDHMMKNPIDGIPHIIDLFEAENSITVIEEYVDGKTLEEVLKDGPTGQQRAVEVTVRLCRILDKLHNSSKVIIHRDIKPSNVMISREGEVFLIDLNAAKSFKENEKRDTVLLGTEGYAAPEQYGFGASTVQTDIYGLGVLLNVMMTGKHPSEEMADGEMGAVIASCTELSPMLRCRSVRELESRLLSL